MASEAQDGVMCGPATTDAVKDFGAACGSAKQHLERLARLRTLPLPSPLLATTDLLPHRIPLYPPLPDPALLPGDNGDGKTLSWPHPDLEQEAEIEIGS